LPESTKGDIEVLGSSGGTKVAFFNHLILFRFIAFDLKEQIDLISRYYAKKLGPEASIVDIEEAAANAAQNWIGNRAEVPPGFRNIFRRFWDRVRHALVSLGLANENQKIEDIFWGLEQDRLQGKGTEDRTERHRLEPENRSKSKQELVNPIDPKLSDQEKVLQLEQLRDEAIPVFKGLLNEISNKLGLSTQDDFKDNKKAIEKTHRPDKPEWYSLEHLGDYYRGAVTLTDPRQIINIAKMIDARGMGVVEFEYMKTIKPEGFGYRDMNFTLRMPNGLMVEFQAIVKEIAEVKPELHKIYSKWRGMSRSQIVDSGKWEERYSDQQRSYAGYNNAWRSSLKRWGISHEELTRSLMKDFTTLGLSSTPNNSHSSSTVMSPPISHAPSEFLKNGSLGVSKQTLLPSRSSDSITSDNFISTSTDKISQSSDNATFSQGKSLVADTENLNNETEVRYRLESGDNKYAFNIMDGYKPSKMVKGYKAFVRDKDGNLKPLFVSNDISIPIGKWLEAKYTWHFQAANGNYYVPTGGENAEAKKKKDEKKTGVNVPIPNEKVRAELIKRGFLPENSKAKTVKAAAYRPGWHGSLLPLAKQLGNLIASISRNTGASFDGYDYSNVYQEDIVFAEVEFDMSNDYQGVASKETGLQRMPEKGGYQFTTNKKNEDPKNPWFISGAIKVGRVLDRSEVNELVKKAGLPIKKWRDEINTSKGEGVTKDGVRFRAEQAENTEAERQMEEVRAKYEGTKDYELVELEERPGYSKGFSYGMTLVHYRGKAFHKGDRRVIDMLLEWNKDAESYTSTQMLPSLSTQESDRLFNQFGSEIVVVHDMDIEGKWAPEDADAGRYYGYDEFRVEMTANEALNSISQIILSDEFYEYVQNTEDENTDDSQYEYSQDYRNWVWELINPENPWYDKIVKASDSGYRADFLNFYDGSGDSRIKYKDGYLKAPNGKPTNLNERQWLQVRTENFKKWFGDWENDPANASKVVDENGEPLVVYHGTGKAFTVFKYGDIGFHSGTIEQANNIADTRDNSAIIPVFLNIRNVLETVDAYAWSTPRIVAFMLNNHEIITDQEYNELESIPGKNGKTSNDETRAITELLIRKGYDGIVYANTTREGEGSSFIAFTPAQIKSATGNTGAFDPQNPDIRYRLTDPEVNAKFNEDLSLFAKNELPKRHKFSLGSPGLILIESGFPDAPIEMLIGVLKDKIRSHDIDTGKIINLPQAINDPVFVAKSKSKERSLVVFTEIEHADGNLMVAVSIDKVRDGIKVNDIRSIYGKNSENIIAWFRDDQDQFTFINENKSLDWLNRSAGSQSRKFAQATKAIDKIASRVGLSSAKFAKVREMLEQDSTLRTRVEDTDLDARLKRAHELLKKYSANAEAERQMAEVRKQYEGTDQWMKAPNGKKTNLNERQWLQVRTPNFKKWFGDWENDPKNASKVVDENGEPMVVYHGTNINTKIFTEFEGEQVWHTKTESVTRFYSGSGQVLRSSFRRGENHPVVKMYGIKKQVENGDYSSLRENRDDVSVYDWDLDNWIKPEDNDIEEVMVAKYKNNTPVERPSISPLFKSVNQAIIYP